MKPRIGVTVSKRSGWRIFPLIALNIWLAGGRAVKWQSADQVDIDAVDGIVIGGGDDIAPTLYGAELKVQSRLDHSRDALERWIVETAISAGVPLLGICRGAQMINVASGGSLDQDAYTTFAADQFKTILPRKRVSLFDHTRLAAICGPEDMSVNALHSQAVERLGDDLRVAAQDAYGMVQAIERTADPFAIGVQWHPEHLFYAKRQRALFAALIAAAKAYRSKHRQIGAVDEVFA